MNADIGANLMALTFVAAIGLLAIHAPATLPAAGLALAGIAKHYFTYKRERAKAAR